MSSIQQRIRDEFIALGYPSELVEGDETSAGPRKVVVFGYPARSRRLKGRKYTMGISTQCEAEGKDNGRW